MKKIALSMALAATFPVAAELVNIDSSWRFALGNTDPALDHGAGTEYFNYLTKAASIHNAGPYAVQFNDSAWSEVDLPFDFVVDLPFSGDASHSHGYKAVGYKYPAASVGWYRKVLPIAAEDSLKRISLVFDGIFRDSKVWVNGFYLGGEPSGYAQQRYDVTPYVNFGGDNVIAVRSDATFEEGWFYEGGGIYRHAWLDKLSPRHISPNSVAVAYEPGLSPLVKVSGRVANKLHAVPLSPGETWTLKAELLDRDCAEVASETMLLTDLPKAEAESGWNLTLRPAALTEWDLDNHYLYTLRLTLDDGGSSVPSTETVTTGFRRADFDPDRGFLLNGRPVKLKGVNMHQDHAGVGAGIPDALNVYRLKELKKYGVNAYRASHNPMTPEVLAACDSLGILVIEENRLLGINDYHTGQLRRMINRDRNHPSVILWSVGNEEWGVEWDAKGTRIVSELRDLAHRLDSTRLMTVATSSGPMPVITADVAGYNYIMQNPVDRYRSEYPLRKAYGSEETSGCGTRGIYFDDRANGRMASLNRTPDKDGTLNRIGRGWKFYDERPWLGGLFYWTGFDYRGEPNPLEYPATGSEFGLLDYCGFPKDEAWYLKSWWTDEPTLHIFPHWNLKGHEGEEIDIWAYSNMDEVELRVNGKSLGRKTMPRNGYLSWTAVYKPGKVEAIGYKDGRRVMTRHIETTGEAVKAVAEKAYSQDGVEVINVSLVDGKGRIVPDACNTVTIALDPVAGMSLLGAGNGDPAFRGVERPAPLRPGQAPSTSFSIPAFNGHAQFILSNPSAAPVSISLD